ncbi:MAG TPA: glycosyltransferase [Planctomycetaceae bacterium]|nr:glycosyltransferase [Planctomycetaceae bacterium]
MSKARDQTLLVIPPITAHRSERGYLVLTDKFLSGMKAYADRWPGPVTALVRVTDEPDNNLDHLEVVPNHFPFGIEQIPQTNELLYRRMREAAIVLGGPRGVVGAQQVTVAETSLPTRLQIIAATTPGIVRRYKRFGDACLDAYRERRAVQNMAGIQCNGTPTYNAYKAHNSNCLLFFDSRIEANDLIASDELLQRTDRLRNQSPLRIAFSGRLVRIKGVDGIPAIADELRRRGVCFEFDIFGGGECEEQVRKEIQQRGLQSIVRLRGVLRYREELLPGFRKNVDLFVCPHVQGDPSCTYIETLACGVPILGYANEAWNGMVPLSGAGWTTAVRDIAAMAAKIAQLDRNRNQIIEASVAARTFAAKHLFESTMDRRVEHLVSCLHA